MKKRLRKKKRVGEFAEFVFCPDSPQGTPRLRLGAPAELACAAEQDVQGPRTAEPRRQDRAHQAAVQAGRLRQQRAFGPGRAGRIHPNPNTFAYPVKQEATASRA